MFKLLGYMKSCKKEALLELLVPLVIAAVIDTGIAGGDRGYVVRMCLLLVGLGIVGLVFSITAQYFAAKASVGFVAKLRHALFDHIQGLSYTELDTIGTSTLITRMTSDMNQVQSGMNLTLRLLLRSPFVVFGAMIMAFTIDVKAALIFAAAIPVLSLVVFGIMLWCIPLYKRVQRKLDGVLSATRENLTGVRVIRAFCKEEEQISRFDACNQDLTRTQKYVGRISALMNPVTYILINLAIIWLVYTGALRVEAGLISQGAVVALYNYMSQILVELIKLANLIINITKSVACGNRIQSVFEIRSSLDAPEQAPAPKDFSYAVEFDHVTLRYANAGDDSLSDISFAARPGETIGVIGSTGSGKSSLVNLIPRFYDASAGQVLVNGIHVKEYPLDDLRNRIGVVPQKAVLFKGTIRDNLRWGNPDATDVQLLEGVQTAQAGEVLAQKGGLDFELEQGGKNLSGGQKQRFTIARALVKHPKILILDDSASALDFATDAALRKAIREMPGNPTVFIVSQRTSSLQHADQILVLEDGTVVGAGTHTQLLESCPVYQEIYQSQFRKEDA